MKRILPLIMAIAPAAATGQAAAPIPPDPGKVTRIVDAAKQCDFDGVGLIWKESAADTLEVSVSERDLVTPSPGMIRLRDCFFGWAYDRKVKVVMNGTGSKQAH